MPWFDPGSAQFRAPIEAMTFFGAGLAVLAVWAGLSRRHWFLRALVVCLAIATLLPIRAYEPVLLFMLVVPLTAVTVAIISLSPWRLPAFMPWLPAFKCFLFAFSLFAAVVMCVTCFLGVAGAFDERTTSRTSIATVARIALLLILIGAYGPLAVVYQRMLAEMPVPEYTLPETNAYPQIMAAVHLLRCKVRRHSSEIMLATAPSCCATYTLPRETAMPSQTGGASRVCSASVLPSSRETTSSLPPILPSIAA